MPDDAPIAAESALKPESTGALLRTFGSIGLNSFGGPAGQIAVMHRVLVEEKRWIDETRFTHALNFCMMLPGPEATQLATYVGWLKRGTLGGLIAGGLFVLPGAACMLVLSAIYAAYGSVPTISGMLLGLRAAVIVLVAVALLRIATRVIRTRAAVATAIIAFLAQLVLHVPFPIVVAAAAMVGLLLGERAFGVQPAASDEAGAIDSDARRSSLGRTALVALVWLAIWLAPLAGMIAAISAQHVLSREAVLFSKASVVTFGGAYAVLGYIGERAGAESWLSPGDMSSGLALAETTPGPLILVGQFVGFLGAYRTMGGVHPMLAGTLGAAVFLWATFIPCFLWIFVGAPYMERLRESAKAQGVLAAVSAAVVGTIAHLGVWLALHTLFGTVNDAAWNGLHTPSPQWQTLSLPALVFTLLAAGLMFWLRWKPGQTLIACAIGGFAWALLATSR